MRTLCTLGLVALALVAASCGPTVVDASPPCLRVNPAEQSLTTAPPARVSLFFSVDTCAGKPVSGLSASDFALEEDGRPVSALEAQTTIQSRGQRYRLHSLLLLDLSGSVLRSGGFPALKEAADHYIDRVLSNPRDGQQVAVYAFDGRPALTPVVDFTSEATALHAGLERLTRRECSSSADCSAFADRRSCAGWLCVDDSTNLNGAVVQGLERLDRAREADPSIPLQESALVLFTDGTDQAARVSEDAVLTSLKSTRSYVVAVGLGGEVDAAMLAKLGKDGFEPVARADELSEAFDAIAGQVLALANRFYLLEYCSPKRSGRHTLKVTARVQTDRGPAEGSLSRTFDATGFESGCTLR